MRNELIADIQTKLEKQKSDCAVRIAELEKNDPFNLSVSVDADDDRTAPDDEASLNEQHERITTQIDAQQKMITKIESALERIVQGTYGVCEVCNKEIEESRLAAMPLAALCLDDEKSNEKRTKKIT